MIWILTTYSALLAIAVFFALHYRAKWKGQRIETERWKESQRFFQDALQDCDPFYFTKKVIAMHSISPRNENLILTNIQIPTGD